MDQRRDQAAEFYQAALDPEERPWFVSDQASLNDIYLGAEDLLAHRCKQHYGAELRPDQFALPLRRLLDYLAENRTR